MKIQDYVKTSKELTPFFLRFFFSFFFLTGFLLDPNLLKLPIFFFLQGLQWYAQFIMKLIR